MSGVSAARAASRSTWLSLLSLSLVLAFLASFVAPGAAAFEAFDGRLQAHGFYESQLRVMNADYSEDWDVTQWYQVFNLELELDLIDETVGIFDLLSAYVRAEVRYDCIYSRGCGMFRSMNTYGDRSKSLPRRLSNATQNVASGEIPIRNDGRVTGSTTDPVPISQVAGFKGIADTEGQGVPNSATYCGPGQTPGVDCWEDPGDRLYDPNDFNDVTLNRLGTGTGDETARNKISSFDYTFERFSDFRFSMVNVKGGGASGNPILILGPWLPKNNVATIGTMSDRVNPFDNSRVSPVLSCDAGENSPLIPCPEGIVLGNGARPFRPIPIFAEDYSRPGPDKIRVVVYRDETGSSPMGCGNGADPTCPTDFKVLEIDTAHNHGDARFNGTTSRFLQLDVSFSGDSPTQGTRTAFDVRDLQRETAIPMLTDQPNPNWAVLSSSDLQPGDPTIEPGYVAQSATRNYQARGLYAPSKPLREALRKGDVDTNWPLNMSENERAWNRGLAQRDEKELKEAYFDIEMFDSRLWLRVGKQQIVWGKTELFRTTDQFNPQDLALATLPSLEESRIGLWSVRGVWSFYEVGPFSDFRLELAANVDDYESSDFGSCGEPYVVNLVCAANFGAFAHGFTGIGIVGIEAPPDPWQSLKGWEIGGRIEWRWERFSFALSDFWGYADLPGVRRLSTYERNVDSQTGRPLVYQGGIDPAQRRLARHPSYALDTDARWALVGQGDDPWQDPFGDVAALRDEQQKDKSGVAEGRLPSSRFVDTFVVRASRQNCGTSRGASNAVRFNSRGDDTDAPEQTSLVPGSDCLTGGPTQLFSNVIPSQVIAQLPGQQLSDRDLAVPGSSTFREQNALDSHHANLTLFNFVCAATVGFVDVDPTACAQTVFGSTAPAGAGDINVAEAIGSLLSGDELINAQLASDREETCSSFQLFPYSCQQPFSKGSRFLPFPLPVVMLSNDPGDLDSQGCVDFRTADLAEENHVACGGGSSPLFLSASLSPEQEALLGCGPFWGTVCDQSGIDLLNMEPSIVLQSFAGASGTLEAIRLKQQGISPPGTQIIDPENGKPAAFRDPNEYRTDEGLQPGTLPWEVSGLGGPLCSSADIGGDLYPRGQDKITVPRRTGGSQVAARPATRKQALPGCHRKWVDEQNGYLNLAWGQPVYQRDAFGNLEFDTDPDTGERSLPKQLRTPKDRVVIDYQYYSGDPDPLAVVTIAEPGSGTPLSFPDSVYGVSNLGGNGQPCEFDRLIFCSARPAIGKGHPFASRRAQGLRTQELIVPFANELAGLSWNFQMISVAFSEEFLNGLETVGDLADPEGANLEGGSIKLNKEVTNPDAIAANKRAVAQFLLGYCGSDYGLKLGRGASGQAQGTCRISGLQNDLPALNQLFAGLFFTEDFDFTDLDEQQRLFDSLMFIDVAMVESVDATRDQDEVEVNLPVTGENNILRNQHCSFITPQYCSTVQNLFALAGLKRNTLEAGGNGTYGRRTMSWHSGGEITLFFPKRNVLGFALDFAEDRTKSNFSIETTWIENTPTFDADAFDNRRNTDEFNMTISVDRPTFVNFLNPNRTLFINSQWFFQYRRGVKKSFGGNGPFNALATLTVFTGYFQDRLNPQLTFIHDVQSASGGLLPSINYRFSENFSATLGMAFFYGREQRASIPNNGIGPASNQQGDWAYEGGAQNGISIVRDRDEAFLRLRYTF